MIHLITYGDRHYDNAKQKLLSEANSTGWFDTVIGYGPDDLDTDFKNNFQNVLEQNKGGGYWIWKPYIIKKHLDKINDNDILIYLDAGCSINIQGKDRFNEYIEILNQSNEGWISFQLPFPEKEWTIKEVFHHFKIDEDGEIANTRQLVSGIQIFKKNSNSIKVVDMWNETLYNNRWLFTDNYNKTQSSYFKDNRHDQSIISIIKKIHNPNPILLTDETYFDSFGNEESLKYPFWATRRRS